MYAISKLAAQEKAGEWNDERLYRGLFVEAPIACFSVGVDGRVLAANRRALDLVGYRPSEIMGRAVLDLYADTPAGKRKAEEQFLLFRSGAEVRGTELEMRRANGRSVWIMLSATPIRDHTGQVTASCSVVQEILRNTLPAATQLERDQPGASFEGDTERFGLVRDPDLGREIRKRFLVKSGSTSYFVRIEDIDWVGAAGNYVELHIGKKSHLMRKTMNSIEAKLDPRRFLRIHRSVIVNIERMKELRSWHYGDHKIVLFDGTQLTLKRAHREGLERLVGEPI